MRINPRQRKLCKEYAVDLNPQRASDAAGYSPSFGKGGVFTLLKKPEIQALIEELQQGVMDKLDIKREDVIQTLAQIAFSDLGEYIAWDNHSVKVFDSGVLSKAQRQSIVSVTQHTTKDGHVDVRLKLQDKVKALELLGKYFGMFVEKSELPGAGGSMLAMMEEQLKGYSTGDRDVLIIAREIIIKEKTRVERE